MTDHAPARVRSLLRDRVLIEHGAPNQVAGDRIAVLAHHSERSLVTRSVNALVSELISNGYHVVVGSSCTADEPLTWGLDLDLDHMTVLRKPNLGYDFGSWSVALERTPAIGRAQHVLLLNDSLAGPFAPIGTLLGQFEERSVDLWGFTDSPQHVPHLQSYAVGGTGSMLVEGAVGTFWEDVAHHPEKTDVIANGELALARVAHDAGLALGAAYPWPSVGTGAGNPVVDGWKRLLNLGFPFVKRELLREPDAAVGGYTVPDVVRRKFGVDVSEWVDDLVAAAERAT